MNRNSSRIITGTIVVIAGLVVTYYGTDVVGVIFIAWAALPIATIGGILVGYGVPTLIDSEAPRVTRGAAALLFGFVGFLASTLVYSAYTDAAIVLNASVYVVGVALTVVIVGGIEAVLLLGSVIDSRNRDRSI